MSDYHAPVEEMMFTAAHVADLGGVQSLPGYEDVSTDLVQQILDEAGKLGSDILDQLREALCSVAKGLEDIQMQGVDCICHHHISACCQ